jgi:hypothetical protein
VGRIERVAKVVGEFGLCARPVGGESSPQSERRERDEDRQQSRRDETSDSVEPIAMRNCSRDPEA